METITHREMRNNSAEILRRVGAGETLQVSNNGKVVATIAPASQDTVEAAIARGAVRRARNDSRALADVIAVSSSRRSAEIIADARGQW